MKKILIPIVTLFFVVGSFIIYKISKVPAIPVHYHANFAVFIDGVQKDFTSPVLMHIKPCTVDEAESSDPKENVHLHDQVGNVVHLHADGINWKLFFSTIHFDIDAAKAGKQMSVYSHGTKVDPAILEAPIAKRDELLVDIGTASGVIDTEQKAVGTSAANYDEGKVGVEKCGAVGSRTLWQRFKLAFGL